MMMDKGMWGRSVVTMLAYFASLILAGNMAMVNQVENYKYLNIRNDCDKSPQLTTCVPSFYYILKKNYGIMVINIIFNMASKISPK